MNKVLVISTCFDILHENEFINPIIQILNSQNITFTKTHISTIDSIKEKFSKIIICGTALKDFDYENYDISNFLKENTKIPIFGICSGAQLLAKYFNLHLVENKQIGMKNLICTQNNKTLQLEKDSIYPNYILHSKTIDIKENSNITTYLVLKDNSNIIELSQIQNCTLAFYHPEIKHKELIINWLHN